jgi:hypothetical protein
MGVPLWMKAIDALEELVAVQCAHRPAGEIADHDREDENEDMGQ